MFTSRAERRIIPYFQDIHHWTKLHRDTMRERGMEKSQNIWGRNKFNCLDIVGKGRNSVLYNNFTQEFVPMKRSQESSSHNFLWRWKQAHVVSSRGTAYLWDKILWVTLKARGVRDTLKCEPGKKEVWTPNAVLFSELRGIESYVWFRRLWRSVSPRRMPRETGKYKQKIFQPKQCWFQMQRWQWKRNERRS